MPFRILNMRVGTLLFALLLGGAAPVAQENCTNGIDDDADGLVDLNDSDDCSCALASTTPSLLPNPSLERYASGGSCYSARADGAPDAVNQASCLEGWQRVSAGTTDAWNAFTLPGHAPYFPSRIPQPIPSGTGVGGFWVGIREAPDDRHYNDDGSYTERYREYLAACLVDNQRMERGEEYRLTFSLGFMEPQWVDDDPLPLDIASPGPVELAIYGVRECGQLNYGEFLSCPEEAEASGYELVAKVQVDGTAGAWTAVDLTFTSPGQYAGFAIGGSCAADRDRGDPGIGYRNYYFIDDLILNKPSAFLGFRAGPVAVDGLTVCETVELHGTPQAGATYQWFRDGVAMVGATESSLVLPESSPEGSYTLRVATPGGCALTDEVRVRRPTVQDRLPDTLVMCSEVDSLRVMPRHPGAASFRWSDGSGGTHMVVREPGTYGVTITEACISREEVFVVVAGGSDDADPEITITGGGCAGEPVRLQPRSGLPGTRYYWRDAATGASIEAGIYDGVLTLPAGTADTLLLFSRNSCGNRLDTVFLPAADTFARPPATLTDIGCAGNGSIALRLDSEQTLCEWFDAAGNPLPAPGSRLEVSQPGTYTVRLFDGRRCPASFSYSIGAAPPPFPIGTEPAEREYSVRPGESIVLVSDMFGAAAALGKSSSPAPTARPRLSWFPGEGLSCTDCMAPAAAPRETTVYTLTYDGGPNCQRTERIRVTVGDELPVYAPTAFSPNGDGQNDRFRLYPTPGLARVTELRVFDRWGELVWQADRDRDAMAWDGTFRGKILGGGVYVYAGQLRLSNGLEISVEGTVTLVD